MGNLADYLRDVQKSKKYIWVSIISGFLKNGLLLIEKAGRKIDRLFFIEKNIDSAFKQCKIYFSTYFPVPEEVRRNPEIRKVYTIHDIIPIKNPEYFSSPYNQLLVKDVVDHIGVNDYIITFSDSTKNDILIYRPDLIQDQIIVVPLAASDNFHQVLDERKRMDIQNKYNIPERNKYLLSVCTLEPRKNLKTLLSAFRDLLTENKIENLNLVLTGSKGWGNEVLLDEISELNCSYKDSVILTGFIADNELAILYSNTYAFIYPSLYEGFGLPPLEAMQCGVPVIASNTSSIPEVVGDCGILIDPLNKIELMNAIETLYNNLNFRNTLAQKALIRASSFNWSVTTKRIISVLKSAVKE